MAGKKTSDTHNVAGKRGIGKKLVHPDQTPFALICDIVLLLLLRLDAAPVLVALAAGEIAVLLAACALLVQVVDLIFF